MQALSPKVEVIEQLQRQILSLQGYRKPAINHRLNTGLPELERAFPYQTFSTGVVHEFISRLPEHAAATNGFISGLLSLLMQDNGACLWISSARVLFPPALKLFGIDPERVVFIDAVSKRDALWVVEEALKCNVLTAVVGEIAALTFTESRRLQLAVEESKVTGFIHRYNPKTENTTACFTRWKVEPLASTTDQDVQGVGFPKWKVQLLKVRNGFPGTWDIEWEADRFKLASRKQITIPQLQVLKTG